jgi:hypothetical protein
MTDNTHSNDARARMAAMTRASVVELTCILGDLEGNPVTGQAVRHLLRRYGIEPGTDRRYDVAAVLAARKAQKDQPKNTAGTSPNRDRKTALECELLEVRIADLKGEYQREAQAEAESAAVEFASRIRSAFRGIAQKVAPMVAGTPADIPRCARLIGAEVDAVLAQLAESETDEQQPTEE